MLPLYNALLLPIRLGVAALSAWQGRNPDLRLEWDERLVRRLPATGPRTAWIHGASVGEARIVSSLAGRLRQVEPERPIATSAVTRTGRSQLP